MIIAVKKLRGVAHDLAHHSQSSLSWLHPHLAEACQQAGVRDVAFDLLEPEPYPCGLAPRQPLQLALMELQQWFLKLLDRVGFERSSVDQAILSFQFRASDGYNSAVQAIIVTSAGKEYSGHVDFI